MTHLPLSATSSTAPMASFPASKLAARAACGGAALAVVALLLLHILQPELDPSWHMISEYALGPHGWIMAVCFAAFAGSSASLFVALKSAVTTLLGRFGLVFLLIAAVGLATAARFPTDPPKAPPEAITFSGHMHGVSFMVGVPAEILAALLLSLALRKQRPWRTLPLLAIAVVIWVSLAVMVAAIMAAMQNPTVTEGVGLIGIANRSFMGAYAVWLMMTGWPIARASAR